MVNKAPTDEYERIIGMEDFSIQWLLGTHRSDTKRNRREIWYALNPDADYFDRLGVDYDKVRLKKVYMRPIKSKDEDGDWWRGCTKKHPRAVKATMLSYVNQ